MTRNPTAGITMTDYSATVAQQFAFAEKFVEKGTDTFDEGLSKANLFAQGNVVIKERDIGIHTPAKFNLEAVEAITPFNMPVAYTLSTTGLFQANPPEGTAGVFTTPAPETDFNKIDAVLNSIPVPVLETVAMPTMHDININPVPTVSLPVFDPKTVVEVVDKPINQQPALISQYERMRPDVKKWVDDGVDSWIVKYAPNYKELLAAAQNKLMQVMANGRMLRDDYQTYLQTQSRTAIEDTATAAINGIINDRRRAGANSLPQSMTAGIAKAKQAKYKNQAIANTTIEIKIIEMETENIKWAVTEALRLQGSLMQAFLGYAGVMVQVNEAAWSQGKIYCDMYAQYYEMLLKRLGLQLDALKTESAIYDTQLKAALSVLDGYRLELDAKKTLVAIDGQRLDFVGKQIQVQLAKVQIYTALLGSVETRANVEMSKVKLFSEEVNAYNSQLQGDKIRNDIFLAGQSGDMNKLKAKEIELEAWTKTTDALIKAKQIDIATKSFGIEKNKMLMSKFGYDIESLKTEYERDRLLIAQDQFNAKIMTDVMTNQVQSINQHYMQLGNLYAQAGQTYSTIGASAINAATSSVTLQV